VFTLGPFATNCYIVESEAGVCWVVDVGFEPGPIIDHLLDNSLTPEAVILTHGHADHIAGLGELKRTFPQTPILIHELERDFLSDPSLNLSAMFGEALVAPEADRLLVGGETLTMGDTTWNIIHTPGHSPGSVTLYCPGAGVALVGDTLFADSIGRFDFPTSDGLVLFESIRQKLYTLPDETIVLPGHGPTTTIGQEKRCNPFVRIEH